MKNYVPILNVEEFLLFKIAYYLIFRLFKNCIYVCSSSPPTYPYRKDDDDDSKKRRDSDASSQVSPGKYSLL